MWQTVLRALGWEKHERVKKDDCLLILTPPPPHKKPTKPQKGRKEIISEWKSHNVHVCGRQRVETIVDKGLLQGKSNKTLRTSGLTTLWIQRFKVERQLGAVEAQDLPGSWRESWEGMAPMFASASYPGVTALPRYMTRDPYQVPRFQACEAHSQYSSQALIYSLVVQDDIRAVWGSTVWWLGLCIIEGQDPSSRMWPGSHRSVGNRAERLQEQVKAEDTSCLCEPGWGTFQYRGHGVSLCG